MTSLDRARCGLCGWTGPARFSAARVEQDYSTHAAQCDDDQEACE